MSVEVAIRGNFETDFFVFYFPNHDFKSTRLIEKLELALCTIRHCCVSVRFAKLWRDPEDLVGEQSS